MEAKADYVFSLQAALIALRDRNVAESLWPPEVVSLVEKERGGESGVLLGDDGPIDAAMRAFMELERRLKAK